MIIELNTRNEKKYARTLKKSKDLRCLLPLDLKHFISSVKRKYFASKEFQSLARVFQIVLMVKREIPLQWVGEVGVRNEKICWWKIWESEEEGF